MPEELRLYPPTESPFLGVIQFLWVDGHGDTWRRSRNGLCTRYPQYPGQPTLSWEKLRAQGWVELRVST